MCGICGVYGWDDPQIINNMIGSIAHRGPDKKEVLHKPPMAFGVARLSLVAPEGGQMPFVDYRRKLIVLFNGEMYNYHVIRDQLILQGESFNTDGEAEVIAALYRKYGDIFAKHLEGMFAIAVADKNRIVLARDRCGIKPLFFYSQNGCFAFASEMKALLPLLPFQPTINRAVIEEAVVFGYPVTLNETIFGEIKQVLPGGVIKWETGNIFSSHYSRSLLEVAGTQGELLSLSYEQAVDELSVRLFSAVDEMWHHGADEKGIYLSGGLDSSLITVMASQVSDTPVNTFTLTDGYDHADNFYAAMVAKKTGSDHHVFVVTAEDYLEMLPHYIVHFEGIVLGGVFDIHGGLAFHLLSEKIGKQMRVAFSGEGADELFGGYYWIHTHPLGFSDRIRSRADKVQKQSRVHGIVQGLFPLPEDESIYRDNLFKFLHGGGLVNYHLTSVDRSGGAFGFEIRPVYLHPKVIDLACRLPIAYKVPDKKTTKRILRDVAYKYFDKMKLGQVIKRTKMGMPAAVKGIASALEKELSVYGSYHKCPHPFEDLFATDEEFLMFDLFFYLMVCCRGKRPEGFSIKEFVESGTITRMYN